MAGRGRPGRPPQSDERARFALLIARGVGNAEACRVVGVHPKTGKRWRLGRAITSSSGRRLHYPPVISARKAEISPRFLSEDERVRIADLRREGLGVRVIARQLGRSPLTVSRELRRNCSPASGCYRPFAAQRLAAGRRARPGRGKLNADPVLCQFVAAAGQTLEPGADQPRAAHRVPRRPAGRCCRRRSDRHSFTGALNRSAIALPGRCRGSARTPTACCASTRPGAPTGCPSPRPRRPAVRMAGRGPRLAPRNLVSAANAHATLAYRGRWRGGGHRQARPASGPHAHMASRHRQRLRQASRSAAASVSQAGEGLSLRFPPRRIDARSCRDGCGRATDARIALLTRRMRWAAGLAGSPGFAMQPARIRSARWILRAWC